MKRPRLRLNSLPVLADRRQPGRVQSRLDLQDEINALEDLSTSLGLTGLSGTGSGHNESHALSSLLNSKTEDTILNEVDRVHSKYGVWPISFSFPSTLLATDYGNREQILSQIQPGMQYQYSRSDDYYNNYRHSVFAITHRKAGWDCFRHVEILGSGCIPLMPDARQIPWATMVHYPKGGLVHLLENLQFFTADDVLLLQTLMADHTSQHLTTSAMARYLVNVAGRADTEQVLFLDKSLHHTPDYLSVLTLIGLKQLKGSACQVFHSAPYIYKDYASDLSRLYGRGFGYTRAIRPSLRAPMEGQKSWRQIRREIESGSFGLVVLGSSTRNADLLTWLLKVVPGDSLVILDGEDQAPSEKLLDFYRATHATVFVRELS